MITLYGIKNCDTVKKARKHLEADNTDYHFHDVRGDGLTLEQVRNWQSRIDWTKLVNKRSTTWKQLDEAQRDSLSEQTAADLLVANPTLLKRPVIDTSDTLLVGYNANDVTALKN